MIIAYLLILILFTFLTELMYGIFHFNYNQKPVDLIKVRQYALLVKQDYALYKKTSDNMYKDKIIEHFNQIEKYMDVYDVRYTFGIDLINIKKEIMPTQYQESVSSR